MTQPTDRRIAEPAPHGNQDPVREALERAIGFQYEITRLLGRGGMGAVYHAHERALDRPVAIKVLPPEAALGAARERFLREARTAARLTHPHIVPLFTFGEAQGLLYFVMGYVDGESLEQRLRRMGAVDADTAARILEQLAGALEYAHREGVVHRDVKPDNILLERGTGDAKLTDFGIAKRTSAGETLTGTGLLLGTPRYMSPEQASGDSIDARSDVYALGLVGYAMLVGRPPFDGGSVQEILTQQVTRDAPPLRKLLPEVPSPLAIAIERALRKDPGQRWVNASAMGAALRDEGEDGERLRTTMRRPGVYALTNVLLAVVAGNFSWYFVRHGGAWIAIWMWPWMLAGIGADYALLRWKEHRPSSEIRRIFTEPPRWWSLWWPAPWRRSDDVWTRLPRAVRLLRGLASAAIGGLVLATQAFVLVPGLPARGALQGALVGTGLAALLGSFVGLVVSIAGVILWGRAHGLSMDQSNRILSVSTTRGRFWKQPWVAPLLSPGGSQGTVEPPTLRGLADEIAALVHQLPPPQREIVTGAGDAARRLVAAIDELDDEAARLARDADPAEIARLEARVESLGPETASDSPGQREMRRLYRSQLELLARLVRQAAEVGAQRARYEEQLRALWLQLSALRAVHVADELRATELSEQIGHLLQNVRRDTDDLRAARSSVTL